MKRLLLLLPLLLLLFPLSPLCAVATVPQASVRPLWAAATVPLPGDDGDGETGEARQICTVNSINEKLGLWVTAAHCADRAVLVEQPQGEGAPSQFHPATVMLLDVKVDLAVLFTPDLRIVALRLAKVGPSAGDPVRVLGYPLGLPVLQWTRGYVASLRTPIMDRTVDYGTKTLFDLTVCGGSSGSAVLNASDGVVSILQIGMGRPCSPFSGGVPYETLVETIGKFFE